MKRKILFLFIIIILIGSKFSFAETNIAIKDTIFPPPNNFVAQGWGSCIFLSWDPPDPSGYNLLGYNLYRDDIGYIGFIPIEPRVFIDELVIIGVEYTYMLTALYEEGESDPVTASATPYLSCGWEEDFVVDWHLTGWTTDPVSPNNWEWDSGYEAAKLNWSPSVPNYDMSLISPQFVLPQDSTHIFDLTINMYIDDYSADSSEVMEIWIIHDGQETMIFEWDLDENDDWGSSGGTDWVYSDMDQFAGETIQLKFRSHGSDTFNFNYWYIYMVWFDFIYIPDYGALQGTVTDGSGNPLENVSVHAEDNIGGVPYYNVLTNEAGEYSIDTMMTGTYDITFELEHYNVMVEEDVEILPNQTTTLNMIMTAPTMSIYPTYIDTSMVPNTLLTVYLTISNDGDGPLHWFANIVFPELLKRDIQNFINVSFPKEKIKLDNTPIDRPSYVEECPYQTTSNYPPTKDILDLLFAYDVDTPSGGIGIAGAEFGNGYFLVSEWGHSSRNVFKFDVNGNYISSWEPTWIQGPTGLRDMAFDGEYFYGSNAENTIYSFDEDGNLQGTINSPAAVRSIAYDEDNDAFWVNNWSSDLKLVDRSGNVLNTIFAPPSMYGSAYDNITPGGPYLWIFTGTSTGAGCQVEQYNLNTLALTGVSHSVSGDFPGTIAGGLFASGDIVPGRWVLGGLAQGTPDILFGYELGYWPPPPPPMQGIIEAGQSYDWPLRMNSAGQTPGTILTTDIIFTSEPDVGTITIPVTLTIIGSGVDDVPDISTKLNQNYPNPFNSSTMISFNLATKSHEKAQIKIYNIKGQLVKTFTPMTNDKCPMTTIEWDGKDENGKPVSSGIYFYRLKIGDKVIDTKRCLLLR